MNIALWNPRGAQARERTRIAGTTPIVLTSLRVGGRLKGTVSRYIFFRFFSL